MHAFILAGGFATRLWPLTEKRAKPLLPLAGKPMISHLVERIPSDIPITVSTNAIFANDFEEWKKQTITPPSPSNGEERSARGGAGGGVTILIEDSDSDDQKLGALGAVSKWITEEKIDDDILLLAGDNHIGFDLKKLIDGFDGTPLLAAHDIKNLEQAKHFGTVIIDQQPNEQRVNELTHNVTSFEEKPEQPKSTLISTGATIIPKAHLQTLVSYAADHPDNIGGIFEHFLTQQIPVQCMAFAEPWFDIGSFEAYLEATTALVENNVLKGTNVTDENNIFNGSVILGDESMIIDSVLTNCVLFGNCKIENCKIENCVLDTGCNLQGIDLTGKMIRSDTKLIRNS